MNIFLGNSPWYKEGFYGVRAGSRWPHFERNGSGYLPFPFFLAYATAILQRDQHNVLLVDGIAEGMTYDEFVAKVKAFNPQLVVLEVSTSSFKVDSVIAQRIKESLPGTPIVLCGMHIFMNDVQFLVEHPYVDYVLEGEYEYTLHEFVQRLTNKEDLSGCLGLYYRKDGKRVLYWETPINREFG